MPKTQQEILNTCFSKNDQALRVVTGTSSALTIRLAYDADGNLIYKGEAEVGSGTTEPKWQIQKFFYDANGNLTAVLFAEGDAEYNKVWDNRESYNYN